MISFHLETSSKFSTYSIKHNTNQKSFRPQVYVYPGSEDTSYDSRLVKVMLVPVLGAIDDLLYMHESNINCTSKLDRIFA